MWGWLNLVVAGVAVLAGPPSSWSTLVSALFAAGFSSIVLSKGATLMATGLRPYPEPVLDDPTRCRVAGLLDWEKSCEWEGVRHRLGLNECQLRDALLEFERAHFVTIERRRSRTEVSATWIGAMAYRAHTKYLRRIASRRTRPARPPVISSPFHGELDV